MPHRWKQSRLASLILREDDPERVDVPALLVLLYIVMMLLLMVAGFVAASTFWQDGWSPHGFN